jgi:hypothetical protein
MDRTLREVIALSGFSAGLCAMAFSFNDIVATTIFAVMTCAVGPLAVELSRRS